MSSGLISCLKIIRAKKRLSSSFFRFYLFLAKIIVYSFKLPSKQRYCRSKRVLPCKSLGSTGVWFWAHGSTTIMSRCALTLCASAWSRGTWWWTRGWPLGWRRRARTAAPRTHRLDDRMIKYVLNERADRQNNMRAEVASRLKIIKYVLYMYIIIRETSVWPSLSFGRLVCWSICLS